MKALLISNSTLYGSGYLDHAESNIRALLGKQARVLFVPYALYDRDGYASTARQRFEKMDYALESIHTAADARQAVERAEVMFVGGGNTFRLLKALYDNRVLDLIRARALEGMPYIGSSAGSNVAGPTIRTTNDMPIAEPPSLKALGLVNFQINPHYLDPDPSSKHMGETREQRLREYLEENETPVVALREGCMLWVEDGRVELRGITGARLFKRGVEPFEIEPGARVDTALAPGA
jgi:dipeptidase E